MEDKNFTERPAEYKNKIKYDLASFIEQSFHHLNPGTKYLANWHIDLIADRLEQATQGKIKRLIINMPPRALKSVCVSVAWPAWLLGHDPTRKIMVSSYSQVLSMKHSIDSRSLMLSDWYRELFPETILSKQQNQKLKFATNQHGFRLATSIGGVTTGEGGNFLIVDDPLNAIQTTSQLLREKAIEWFEFGYLTRLDDKKKGVIIVVMQRLHENDLTGYLLRKKAKFWDSLILPAIADKTVTYYYNNNEFTRNIGDILHAKREGIEELEQMKLELGDYNFSAQYQQNPIPKEGAMIRSDWLDYYDAMPEEGEIIHSWDTASTVNQQSAYSVCTCWKIDKDRNNFYLFDVVRKKLEFNELQQEIIKLYHRDNPQKILIEEASSGIPIAQSFKLPQYSCLPIHLMKTEGKSKEYRMQFASTYFVEKRVKLPIADLSWLEVYRNEILSFPNGTYEDQIDSTSQFLNYISSYIKIGCNRVD